MEHPANSGVGRCDVFTCPFKTGVSAKQFCCANDECEKKVHVECFNRIVRVKKNGKGTLPPLPDSNIACTKSCYGVAVKAGGTGEDRGWNSDGKPESLEITGQWVIIDCLTPDVCVAYSDKDNKGITKQYHCEVIASKCAQLTAVTRTWKQVKEKIASMERKWRSTHDWVQNTGQGVLANEGEQSFRDIVLGKCDWYYDWEEIMIDRAASNPPVTSNNLDSSDGEESNGGDDDGDDDDDEDASAVEAVAAGTAAAAEATSDANSAPKKKMKDKKR
jgi:hypothetical protein